MSFTRFLATHVSSPAEEIMHMVHEAVGWSVLATVGAVLVLGGARTYLLHRKTEVELAAAINRSSILKAIVDAHRNYFTPAYRSARQYKAEHGTLEGISNGEVPSEIKAKGIKARDEYHTVDAEDWISGEVLAAWKTAEEKSACEATR